MKIRILSIILLIVLLLTACQSSGAGAGTSYNGLPAITPELKTEIEAALVKRGRERLEWEEYYKGTMLVHETVRYYGTYDGWSIVFSNGGGSLSEVMDQIVGGVYFETSGSLPIMAYRNGELLHLREAYEAGYISKETLQKVADLHIQRELAWYQKKCQKYNEEHPDEPPQELPEWLKPYQK